MEVTGFTHGYGPIGAALGSFIGFADPSTIAGMEAALRDAASQEFDWMSEATSDEERAYHRARWLEQSAAADYAQLCGPKQ
jgi:hypothetical protein